jgi:hypothetical protein
MENQSALKEHLYQLEKRLLEPEIRTAPGELEKLLADDFLSSEVRGMFGIKKIVFVKAGFV